MSLDGQVVKLTALYAEKSDDELLRLYGERDDLTDVAQQALVTVMHERRLEIRGVASGQASLGARKVADILAEGEALIYLFHDAFEAREAMRVLTEAEIPHRMLDWHSVDPELPVSYTGLDLGLVAALEDEARVKGVLKDKLGLFPSAEIEGDVEHEEGGLVLLAMFERAEAVEAARALGEAGFTFLWRDGREPGSDLPDSETVAIEVSTSRLEEATSVVESKSDENLQPGI